MGVTTDKYPVKICCAWCNCFVRIADFKADKPDLISHGICEKCHELEMKEADKLIGQKE